jgi:hypothetical protein
MSNCRFSIADFRLQAARDRYALLAAKDASAFKGESAIENRQWRDSRRSLL